MVAERRAGVVVVGVADHVGGRTSPQGDRSRALVERLRKLLPAGVSVVTADESRSTAEAASSYAYAFGKKAEGPIDDVAAAIVLQQYMDSNPQSWS